MSADQPTRSRYCQCCGEFMLFRQHHRCAPAWEVRSERDGDDDWSTINARDAGAAAERAAEMLDCEGDYSVARSGQGLFFVRAPGERGAGTRYRVTAEQTITYSAEEEEAADAD